MLETNSAVMFGLSESVGLKNTRTAGFGVYTPTSCYRKHSFWTYLCCAETVTKYIT